MKYEELLLISFSPFFSFFVFFYSLSNLIESHWNRFGKYVVPMIRNDLRWLNEFIFPLTFRLYLFDWLIFGPSDKIPKEKNFKQTRVRIWLNDFFVERSCIFAYIRLCTKERCFAWYLLIHKFYEKDELYNEIHKQQSTMSFSSHLKLELWHCVNQFQNICK